MTRHSWIVGWVIQTPCSFLYGQSLSHPLLSNRNPLDWSIFHDSCFISHRNLQDAHPWFRFSNRQHFSNTCQYIFIPQPLFQRDERTHLDSYTTMGSRISAIFTAERGTSQTWPSARLSLCRPFSIPHETLDLWCPCPPPRVRFPLLLCPQRVALSNQCHCWCNSSLLSRSSVDSVSGPQCATAHRAERPLPDCPYHTASGVCFPHSALIYRPPSARVAFLPRL